MKVVPFCGILLLTATLTAQATPAGTDILNLPGNIATDQDMDMMRSAIGTALEQQADGETSTWQNPETGNNGLIRIVTSYQQEDLPCRRLALRNIIEQQTYDWMFSFCKTPEGEWKIAPSR